MDHIAELEQWLHSELVELSATHGIPGAVVAVGIGNNLVEAATGVLSRATDVEVTTDSIFQIGSITKIWTATLAMQLVDEGLLDLDAPVVTYLPEFRTADDAASHQITTRHLLAHTAGFEGDIFADTGEGDDALERYIPLLQHATQVSAPGELYSYNNAAYCVAGRVIEILRSQPFHQVLREHLVQPLALTSVATSASEAILRRSAVGHIPDGHGGVQPATRWSLPRSSAPAGSTLCTTAADLVRFARVHLADGRTPYGTRVLSADSVLQMQRAQAPMPYLGRTANARGIGWGVFNLDGGTVLAHNGGTIGQYAYLRIVPSADLILALLTNGGSADAVHEVIFDRVLRDVANMAFPPLRRPDPRLAPRLEPLAGRYESGLGRIDVSVLPGSRLLLDRTPLGIAAEIGEQPDTAEYVPLDEHTYVLANATDSDGQDPQVFIGASEDGRARFLYNGRVHRRV